MFFNKDRKNDSKEETMTLPLLPLRDLVVFPTMVVPLIVGRERSIKALEEASEVKGPILLATQMDAQEDDPKPNKIRSFGVIASIIQMLRLPDGTVKVLVEGKTRARIVDFDDSGECILAELVAVPDTECSASEVDALVRSVKSAFEQFVKLNKSIPPEMLMSVSSIEEPSRLSDTLVSQLNFKLEDRQAILEEPDPSARLERIYKFIQSEIEILQVEKKIKTRVRKQMERTQKEYYLNEQMQAIQRELGEKDEFKNELSEVETRIRDKKMSEEAQEKLDKEMRKLKLMSPMSAEAAVVRNYIDTVLSLPWYDYTPDRIDIAHAKRVLDEDHHGLEKVKERVLEYLAVASLVDRMRGPILCLVGPPGVGKTSLAQSIARSTNRKFVRLALGGVRDEAEIRGHRRTYIGALPGKILGSLTKADSGNPVFLLDEVDKMSTDFRGDPASALLEVLDPEQNSSFVDHYVGLDYDLSKVMFICTANSLRGIPVPLQDRLEIIRIPGYTEQEKLSIAKRYLIPKQRERNGLTDEQIQFSKEAVTTVVRRYTKEAGVRNLDRELASVCRKVAKRVVNNGEDTQVKITAKNIEKLLGVPKHRYGKIGEHDEVGFVNGLAWTDVGGVMVPIEAASVHGTGKTTLTGQLGSVFQESCQAAITYIRSRCTHLGLKPDFYQETDIHVHVPELWGVDGPSAGITIATAVVSAVSGIAVRRGIAMTGEITLRGQVRPIGGLKEKLLAAHRAGIRTVLIPQDNEQDLSDIPAPIREKLEIIPVSHMDEVLPLALAISDPTELFSERQQDTV